MVVFLGQTPISLSLFIMVYHGLSIKRTQKKEKKRDFNDHQRAHELVQLVHLLPASRLGEEQTLEIQRLQVSAGRCAF